jgi:hypothetical protein
LINKVIYGMIDLKEVINAEEEPVSDQAYGGGTGRIDEASDKVYVTVLSSASRQDDSVGSRGVIERRDCTPFGYSAGGCQYVEKTIL